MLIVICPVANAQPGCGLEARLVTTTDHAVNFIGLLDILSVQKNGARHIYATRGGLGT